jgi:hypothetical protein
MTDSPDFASILDRDSGTIEKPKPLPPGDYRVRVTGYSLKNLPTEKKQPICEIELALMESLTADPEALAAAGGLTRNDGTARTISDTFFLEDTSLWILKEHLTKNLGIADSGRTLRQMLEELTNTDQGAKEYLVKTELENDKQDPVNKGPYTRIKKRTKAD